MSHRTVVVCGWLSLVMLIGCSNGLLKPAREVTLVSTTTTQDSGLLDALLPPFERVSGVRVKVIAVGSGQALELGRRGDADLLLTHSPDAELQFMSEGWGVTRTPLMHNDFVILGPEADPVDIRNAVSVVDAFQKIAKSRSMFISRSDESGTHVREMSLWRAADVPPKGEWYIQAGTGMAACLRLAHEKQAYILSDRGTFLALRHELKLALVNAGDEQLINRYSVITLNSQRFPHLHHTESQLLAEYLVSPAGQSVIRQFGLDRFGEPLFIPDAIPSKSQSESTP